MIQNHKDITRTLHLRKIKVFLDRRSFVTLAGHIYLRGHDRSNQRDLLFRSTPHVCALCMLPVSLLDADYDHKNGGHKHNRCDCFRTKLADGKRCTNVQIVHGMFSRFPCHRNKHNREVKWTSRSK